MIHNFPQGLCLDSHLTFSLCSHLPVRIEDNEETVNKSLTRQPFGYPDGIKFSHLAYRIKNKPCAATAKGRKGNGLAAAPFRPSQQPDASSASSHGNYMTNVSGQATSRNTISIGEALALRHTDLASDLELIKKGLAFELARSKVEAALTAVSASDKAGNAGTAEHVLLIDIVEKLDLEAHSLAAELILIKARTPQGMTVKLCALYWMHGLRFGTTFRQESLMNVPDDVALAFSILDDLGRALGSYITTHS